MALSTEMRSTLRELTLMPLDLAPVLPRSAGGDVAVLVHGLLATAGIFRPLRGRIERETRASVATFTHAPSVRVPAIAHRLARFIAALPQPTRIHLVGHSFGGVVARHCVQELGGYRHVAQTISLGTPFRGAALASRLPLRMGRFCMPDAPMLTRLRQTAHVGGVPHTSIVGTADRVLGSVERGVFWHGELVVLEGVGHNSLLFDRRAADTIVEKIAACTGTPKRARVVSPLRELSRTW